MLENICKSCFEKTNILPCPKCGYNGEQNKDKEILPIGTILYGKYIIGKNLGRGGFGVTYLALDLNLDLKVCIKEYFPASISTRARDTSNIIPYTGDDRDNFDRGREKFVEEGKALAKFNKLKATTIIHDFFMENNTGYLVMEYLEGQDVSAMLKTAAQNKLSLEKTMEIMLPIMDTLEKVHKSGLIHRDISPDNIFVTEEGQAKLLDFGAARYAEGDPKSLSVILKHGYAPLEQYSSRGRQGTWTDVYALGATICKMLTGKTPLDIAERQLEDSEFQAQLNLLPKQIKGVISQSMAIRPNDRVQTVGELKGALISAGKEKAVVEEKKKSVKRVDKKISKKPKVKTVKPKKRNLKPVLAGAGVAVLVALGILIFGGGGTKQEEVPVSVAVEETAESTPFLDKTSISADWHHTVGLKNDGTVVAVGSNYYGQCDVFAWNDIVSISAGYNHTVGLKSDGTVVAVGRNDDGQCNVSDWEDIVSISAGSWHTVGLKSDGTAVAVGLNDDGQCNVSDWEDIVSISAGELHTVGLKSDGTVVAVGLNDDGQCNVSDWNDIVSISAGWLHTVGLKSDGTVVAVGENYYGQSNVSDWNDIVSISAGYYNTVGLKSDGTVAAVGDNNYSQCAVARWNNIVSISSGEKYTVGIKSDGTVVATGSNNYGQCRVEEWQDIAVYD